MKVIIAGSSGMIGKLILNHCLEADQVKFVISLVRKPSSPPHPKLQEIIIKDFEDYSESDELFKGLHAAYFCIGAYTGQVSDELFKKITVDYAVEFAKAVEKNSPDSNFCLLSGAGADKTEKSRTAFARYKGMAENQIAELNLNFYSFRPGYIYPVEKRKEPNVFYAIFRALYPALSLITKSNSIESTELAKAMFNVGLAGAKKEILENQEIKEYIN